MNVNDAIARDSGRDGGNGASGVTRCAANEAPGRSEATGVS